MENDKKFIFEFWSYNNFFSLNWLSSYLGILFIPIFFWFSPNRLLILNLKNYLILHKEFKILTTKNSSTLLFISLFYLIFLNNLLGLFPYIFTSSSHLVFSLTMALPLWLTFMIFGWINNNMNMFAHLVPQGTPPILMPFMVMIETISNLIRPGTLAIRLTANMIAGHLLLTLLGNTGNFLKLMIFLLIFTQILLFILEMAVALIQSYIFAILSTLYSSEVNYE